MAPRASGNMQRYGIFNMDLQVIAQKESGVQAKILQIKPYKLIKILCLVSGDFSLQAVG